MRLNKKIILVTISILLVSLLISSVVNVINFRKNYTEALVSGSYGLGQSINSVLSEMLYLGLPLESLSGMDKKLRQLVENNAYISYAGIADLSGKIIFHSTPEMVGKTLTDEVMQRGLATKIPLTQLYHRFDGHEYYDVTIPVFDADKAHIGVIRLGFPTKTVNEKVNLAIGQVAVNFVVTFAVIALFINFLLRRLVSQPVIALSQQARRISENDFDSEVLVARRDEIGELSNALNQMSRTLRSQLDALQRSRAELEEQVEQRTRELAQYFKFFNSSTDLMGIADPNGAFKKINPAFISLLGYSEAEILAKPFIEFVHPDDRQSTLDEMARQLQRGFSLDFENRYVCKDGSTRWLLWRANVNPEEGFTYATARDITERKQAEEMLRGKTEALLRSNADLDQFAYSVSHDMRQPLRMVTGHLQLLAKGLRDQLDDDNRENLAFALDGAKRMDAMIVSLLEYSRIGRKTESKERIESRHSLDEALRFLAPAIEEVQAGITVRGNWPRIVASRDELTRLFQNLIGNAVHYHEADQAPRVEIDSGVSGDTWRVSVRDHGIGIDRQQMGRLFQFFSRLQSRERFAGTGMGLALCRRIVEHHGGRIWVESEGEGHGSVFIFELPLGQGSDKEAGT